MRRAFSADRASPLFYLALSRAGGVAPPLLHSRAARSPSSRINTSQRLFTCAPGGHQFMQHSYASVIGIFAGALLALQGAAHAQSATIYGSVGNFDVANNQQRDAPGSGGEPAGGHPKDTPPPSDPQRSGAPPTAPPAAETIVRGGSPTDPARGSSATTAAHPAG